MTRSNASLPTKYGGRGYTEAVDWLTQLIGYRRAAGVVYRVWHGGGTQEDYDLIEGKVRDRFASDPGDPSKGPGGSVTGNKRPGSAFTEVERKKQKNKPNQPKRTPQPTKEKGHKSYYTMGRYVGNFRRPRNKRRINRFLTQGSVFKKESTSTSTSGTVAEVGHSTCVPGYILHALGRALVKRLFKNELITDWSVVPVPDAGKYGFYLRYRTAPEVATISATGFLVFTAGLTWQQVALKVMDEIVALYTTTNDGVILEEIELLRNDVTGGEYVDRIKVPLRQAWFTVVVNSHLTIQNITESNTGGTDDHTQVTDIRANPVIGRMFQTKSNGFIPVAGVTEGFNNNIADATGFIGDVTGNMSMAKNPNFYSNSHISKAVMLQPGEIKHSRLSMVKRKTLNGWMKMFHRYVFKNAVTFGATIPYMYVGPSRLFHFEHMVKNTGDPSVSLGKELDFEVKALMYYRVKREGIRIEEV